MADAVDSKDFLLPDEASPSLPEDLQGMEQEAELLAGFLEIPTISSGWFTPAGVDSTLLTVGLICCCESACQRPLFNLQSRALRPMLRSINQEKP